MTEAERLAAANAILREDEQELLFRIGSAISRARDLFDRVNEAIKESGLPIRVLESFPIGQVSNDICKLWTAHEMAEKNIAAAARAAVEQVAA